MDRPRSRGILKIVVLALAGVLVAAVLAVAGSAVYLPGCSFCHMKGEFATATRAASHGTVSCTACHVEPGVGARAAYGYQIVFQMAIPVTPSTGRAAASPLDSACLSCHAVVETKVGVSRGVSIKHSACAKGRSCVECHADTGHGTSTKWVRTYNMDMCLECHNPNGASNKCDTCHQERTEEARIAQGPWTVTHGPNWRTTHGMGAANTCSACHPAGYCVRCHGVGLPHGDGFLARHAKLAVDPGAKCGTCHPTSFCLGCHGLPMPHPTSFTRGHSAVVKRDGDKVCKTCHTAADCTNCHVEHVHPGGAVGGRFGRVTP